MKKNKGFTLIELLAVIVVLAIIMVIATTQVNKVIKKAKADSNEINKKSIAKAAETCLAQENDETKCDTVDKLVENGYLEEFEDPYTKSGEYVSQNYHISFNDDGKAIVDYFGEGYIEQISKDINGKEYFTWDGSTITGLTTEGFNWVKDNDWTLVIPSNATSIEIDAFRYSNFCKTSNSKKTVIIPGNVKTIGRNSFNNCGITSLYLNSGIKIVGYGAFYENNISYLKLPESSIEIGEIAFSKNKLPDDQAFIYKRTSTGIDKTTIVAYGGERKSNVVVPSQVKIISYNSFMNNDIESITLPEGLKTIYSSAFSNNKLTSIIIPNSVEYIGATAFIFNELTSIDVSNVNTVQGGIVNYNKFPSNSPFLYDNKDSSILISYGKKVEGNIVVPEGVIKISSNAFIYHGGQAGVSIYLPKSLKEIENNAFSHNGLKDIYISSGVSKIGDNAFSNCKNLTNIYISNQNPNKESLKANWEKYGLDSDIITFVD